MGGLEDVLARLINERSFREQLTADPAAALAGYDLSREDLEILAASLDEQVGVEHVVEQRTSKSTLLGMLAAMTVDDGAASGLPTGKPRHQPFTVLTPDDQGSSGNVAEDELGSFAEPMEDEGQISFGDGEHGVTPDPGEDGEYLIAEATHDGATTDDHEDQIEIQSWSQVADDGDATSGDMIEVMDFQTGTDVPSQDAAPPAGSDGDPDAPVVIGSPWNDADAVQYEESDLDFVHERGGLEDEQGDVLAGEPAAEVDGEALAESLDVKVEGKNAVRAVEGTFAPETATGDMPTEDETLNPDEIEAEYEPQKDDSALDASPEGTHDIGEPGSRHPQE